jgi:hypothetical protein
MSETTNKKNKIFGFTTQGGLQTLEYQSIQKNYLFAENFSAA